MSPIWILMIFPALALAEISVELVASDDTSHNKVSVSGSDVSTVSDLERQTFSLTDEELKEAVRRLSGIRPKHVHLTSPLGGTHKDKSHEPVTRTVTPSHGEILALDSKPTILFTQKFHNNGDQPTQFNVGLSETVRSTLSSTWSDSSRRFNVDEDINYNLSIIKAAGVNKTFQFKGEFGKRIKCLIIHHEKVGASEMSVNLHPGQSVTAELSANLVKVRAQVHYNAGLKGKAVVKFADYQQSPDLAVCVKKLMQSERMAEYSMLSTETMEIEFYSDAKVKVIDDSTHDVIIESKN